MRSNRLHAGALALALATLLPAAWAGRPLASDDASSADAGTCQLESWVERAGGDGAIVLAPACGLVPGLEVALDYTVPRHKDAVRAAAGVALKWVPEAWRIDTPAGGLNFGLKLALAHERPVDLGWRGTETSALALATLQAADNWALHANLGAARDRTAGQTAGLLNLAVVWTPQPEALLFAELQANNRRAVFGGTVRTVGARWWVLKDRLGLDLTTSREAGNNATRPWTLGLGWYGLSL